MFNYIRNRKIQNAWKHYNREHVFVGLDKVEHVLILFNYDDLSRIMPVARELVKQKKKVFLWTTTDIKEHSSKIYDSSGQSIRVINSEDKSIFNILTGRTLKEFKVLNVDLLLNFALTYDDALYYLILNSKCRFSISLKESTHKIHDFIYLKEEDQEFLDAFNDIQKYIKSYKLGRK